MKQDIAANIPEIQSTASFFIKYITFFTLIPAFLKLDILYHFSEFFSTIKNRHKKLDTTENHVILLS